MATRTWIGDLNLRDKHLMQRAIDEASRRNGRFRELVLRMLAAQTPEAWTPEANGVWQTRVIRVRPARRTEPTRADLVAAWLESPDALPEAICDYIITRYLLETKPLKTGRKAPARTTWQDVMINAFYQHQLRKADGRHKADDSPKTRAFTTRAKARTAKKFRLSLRTIESIIAPHPVPAQSPSLLKPPPM